MISKGTSWGAEKPPFSFFCSAYSPWIIVEEAPNKEIEMTRQEEIEEALSKELSEKLPGLIVNKHTTPMLWLAALEGLRDGWEEDRESVPDDERLEFAFYMLTIHGMIATQKIVINLNRYIPSGRP